MNGPEQLYHRGSLDPDGGLCIMNVVDRRWKLAHGIPVSRVSDLPVCTDEVVAYAAMMANDTMPKREPESLAALTDRAALLLLEREARIMSAVRLSFRGEVRVGLVVVSRCVHLCGDPAVARAVDAIRRWCDGEDLPPVEWLASRASLVRVEGLLGFAGQAALAVRVLLDATIDVDTKKVARAMALARRALLADEVGPGSVEDEDRLIAWLDDVLDAHEKAAADEGRGDDMAERAAEVERIMADLPW